MTPNCLNGHPRTSENVDRWRRCLSCHRIGDREYHQDLKLQALEAYGGPVCAHCGSTDFKKLGLDHINEDGAGHRLALGTPGAGDYFYHRLRDLGWPNDPPLQVLCRACNTRKANDCRIIKAFQDDPTLDRLRFRMRSAA